MSIFTSVELDDYTLLEEESINYLTDTHQEIMKFYPILKKQVYLGNPDAIKFHNDIRGESEYQIPVTIWQKIHYYNIKLNSESLSTIDEFNEILKDLRELPKLAKSYTNRFNNEIAIKGSQINKILITENLIKKTKNGFDAYYNFYQKHRPKNIKLYIFSEKEIEIINKDASLINEHIISYDPTGNAYIKSEIVSSILLTVVERQEMIRRALNKDIYSVDQIENLNKEFYYNEHLINLFI
jgi:hypothetical protein